MSSSLDTVTIHFGVCQLREDKSAVELFFKRANPGLFFVYFRSFQTPILQRDSNLDRRRRKASTLTT